MARRHSAKNVYICTLLIASLASMAASLSLEELSLKIQQLEQNDVAKDARLQELEVKVQHLETKLMLEQEKEYRTPSNNAVQQFPLEGTADLLMGNQPNARHAIFRTCRELHQVDPSLSSGMHWIDPDGQGVGDDPIYVHCDMETGKTAILHDSESATEVGHCADPGCYSRPINYSASRRQMDALSALSSECRQSIRYDCFVAPFEVSGVAQSWWNDRDGVAQYFWSGSNNSVHTCQCGIDHNCVEPINFCNCDSAVPVALYDSGVITDKKYLPITQLNFGRTQLETSSGKHTLGRFECTGQVSVSRVPTSCYDLWHIGHNLNGIYSIMGADYIESVFCNFAKLPNEQGYQVLIGYSDVKSSPVYFYVQKNASPFAVGVIPFELTKLNIGGAMDASSGIFTAPRRGIYSFAFSGIGRYPSSVNQGVLRIALMLNGLEVGRSVTHTQDDDSIYGISLHSTLELRAGDRVSINIHSFDNGAFLYEDGGHYTHFTGHLLQENVASSLNLRRSLF